jgi:hypothetical protein
MLEEAKVMRKQAVAHTFFKHLGYKVEEKKPRISAEQEKFKENVKPAKIEDELKNYARPMRHQTEKLLLSDLSADDFSSDVSAVRI